MCWFVFAKYFYHKFGCCVWCAIPLPKSNATTNFIMATTKKAPKEYTAADLQALKPGTYIRINTNGAETMGRVLAVQPSGRFQARVGEKLNWFDLAMFGGVFAQQPAPAPIVVAAKDSKWYQSMPNELALFVNNCESDDEAEATIGLAVNEANYILGLFDESGTSQSEALNSDDSEDRKWAKSERSAIRMWLKKWGVGVVPAATVRAQATPAAGPAPVADPAHLAGKVSEFGAEILAGIRTLEEQIGHEYVPTGALADLMGENPKRVAAGFVALLKVGAIFQGGEKGGRTVALSPLGNEYLNSLIGVGMMPAIEYTAEMDAVIGRLQAGESIIDIAGPADWAPTAQPLTDAQIAALALIAPGMVAICDIFVADALREIDEAQPLWLKLVPSNTAGAYYDAALAPMGVTELMDSHPEIFAVPTVAPESVAEPVAGAPAPTGKKRGPKNRVSVSAAGERKVAEGATAVRLRSAGPSKGGRPAKGNKSFRELVLREISATLQQSEPLTPKEAHKMIAAVLGVKTTQVQNAFFKLAASGFINTKENGRVATPLALSVRAQAGYQTNHGRNIRTQIEAQIAAGQTDAAIARALGVDISWAHDVRVGRGYKTKGLKQTA